MELKKNSIKIYYLFYGIKSLIFYIPILVIYLSSILKTPFQVGIVLSIKSISVFLLEVPLGYVADKFGRKKSIILSIIANITSLTFLIISPNFYTIIIAELFFSVSETLCSGADISLIYDNLKYENKEELYDEFQRNSSLIGSIMLSISFLLGSWIYSYNKELVFIFSIISSLMLLLILKAIIEQPYSENQNTYKFSKIKEDLKSLKKESFFLKNLIVYGAITTSSFMGIYFYIFPLELNKIINNKLIYGLIYCLGVLLIGFGSKGQKYIKNNYNFIFNGGIIVVPLIVFVYLFKNNISIIIFILFMRYLWGSYSTNLNIVINKNISVSSLRATIFSIKNAILNIFLSVFFLTMGYFKTISLSSFIILKYYAIFIVIVFGFNYLFNRQKMTILKA